MAGREWVHRGEYALFRAAEWAAGRMSWEGRARVGRALGRLWHLVDRCHRRVALDNVRQAFPDRPEGWVRKLVRANFEHLGTTVCEFLGSHRVTREELLSRYRFEGDEHAEAALSEGKGLLVLTAHLGNWELAGTAVAAKGYRFHAIGRRIANPWVDRHVRALRERFGARVIPHRNAVRPVLRVLREGGIVAFLMDQRALRDEAVPSRFFGRPVATNRGLATLALRTGTPVIPVFGRRDGEVHVLRVGPALEPPRGGTLEDRIVRYTRLFDGAIEQAVRECPEQWFWVHRRWRLPGGWAP